MIGQDRRPYCWCVLNLAPYSLRRAKCRFSKQGREAEKISDTAAIIFLAVGLPQAR
jgi:hypothetical protein